MSNKLKAIAATLGLDYESSSQFKNEYQYQAGRTKKPIFTDGNNYFCMSSTKPKDKVGNEWGLYLDQFWAEKIGSKLWSSNVG